MRIAALCLLTLLMFSLRAEEAPAPKWPEAGARFDEKLAAAEVPADPAEAIVTYPLA